ncbi:MAG: flagellar FlbD family protein [Peptococcia bacterium]
MLILHRLNDSQIVVNLDLLETVEVTPDTLITFNSGRKIVVKESIEEVIQQALDYKARILLKMNSLEED